MWMVVVDAINYVNSNKSWSQSQPCWRHRRHNRSRWDVTDVGNCDGKYWWSKVNRVTVSESMLCFLTVIAVRVIGIVGLPDNVMEQSKGGDRSGVMKIFHKSRNSRMGNYVENLLQSKEMPKHWAETILASLRPTCWGGEEVIGLRLGIEEEGGVGWQCGELEFVLLIGRPGQLFQQIVQWTDLHCAV